MDRIGGWLWHANVFALACVVARLAFTRLYRTYPFLFVFFLAEAGGDIVLSHIPLHSDSYAISYMAFQLITHFAALAVLLEMYRVALREHAGLAAFGRASVLSVTLGALVITVFGAFLDRAVPAGQSVIVHRFLTLERTLDVVILVFLLGTACFLTWFPVKLPRNLAFSIAAFSLFYFTRASMLLAVNLLPARDLPAVNDAALALSFLSLSLWLVFLRREPAGAAPVVGHSWDPTALVRLSRQLDSINSALVRFGRH